MATTPPPPSTSLRMPPTPRHGAGYDSYSPYAPRQSARLASQRSARGSRTPEPPTFSEHLVPSSPKTAKRLRSQESEALSPPGSPFGSPQKKTSGRIAAMSSQTSSLNGSDFLHPGSAQRNKRSSSHSLGVSMTDGMLPTPETPRKKNVGDVGSTARALFSSSNASARSRKPKRYTGFSLDSFDDNLSENQTKIEIYTDTRDRIPELDTSDTNPFYQKSGDEDAPPAMRASRRRKLTEHKRDEEVDEAVKRGDGIMYVFRGKKTFRKFREEPESEDEEDEDLGLLSARPDLADADVPTHIRPLTRSSIKPRVLFPGAHSKTGTADPGQADDADEELATDVEDVSAGKDASADSAAVHKAEAKSRNQPTTPAVKSTVNTPASPGAVTRSLRSRAKPDLFMESHDTPTPSTAQQKKHNSPFNGWLRTKSAPAASASKSKKRDADPVDANGSPTAKRSRGVTST